MKNNPKLTDISNLRTNLNNEKLNGTINPEETRILDELKIEYKWNGNKSYTRIEMEIKMKLKMKIKLNKIKIK